MKRKNDIFREYLMITAGTVIMALGVYFFKFPNHFSTGGVSGISIILAKCFPDYTPGLLVFVIDAFLLLLGLLFFGKGFGFRTAYSSLLFSGITWGMEFICPMEAPFTSQPLLELIFAVTLPAIGSAILFNHEASSGGTDVIAMILRKYTHLDIGKALLCVDFLITVGACFAFGMETGLFSLLGLAMKSLIVDLVLESFNVHKCFQIITSRPVEIREFITEKLKRGATELAGEGAYTHENKTVIMTVVTRAQGVQLRQFARQVDPQAFMIITNSSEIIGKGFRGVM